uniref:C2H2-type domain-containing protein n=1 Tax=Romanomermis culicivorax TaxID=13658 RepID=A0A915JGN9_ROMCU
MKWIGETRPPAAYILNIYHHNNHYSVITKMPGFFDRSYFCPHCDIAYSNKGNHRCKSICPLCYNSPPCSQFYGRKCKECNRYFKSDDCFNRHKKPFIPKGENNSKRQKTGTSICDRIKSCDKCDTLYQRAHLKEHKCGYFECKVCKKEVLKKDHQCYMQPEVNEENEMEVTNDDVSEAESSVDKN